MVPESIYYITVNKRFSVLQVKGYPGTDCVSDHMPIVVTMKVKLRTLQMRKLLNMQIDVLINDNGHQTVFHWKLKTEEIT